MPIVQCANCGKSISRKPSKLQLNQRSFCERACQQAFRKGKPSPLRLEPSQAFWSNVSKGSPEACWIWGGTVHPKGYGSFRASGRVYKAHRFSYQIHKGDIPKGLSICHDCDNPSCVNPNHLYAGTQFDNMRDASIRNRFASRPSRPGEAHHNNILTTEQVLEIRKRYEQGNISQSALAREYGVSVATLNDLILRKTWRHI